MKALKNITSDQIQILKSISNVKELMPTDHVFNFKKHKKILVPDHSNIIVLNLSDIVCCKAESNYTILFTKSGKKYVVSRTLKWVMKQLDNTFVRVHRSYVVNLLYVISLNLMDAIIHTINDLHIPVSRSYKKKVVHLFRPD